MANRAVRADGLNLIIVNMRLQIQRRVIKMKILIFGFWRST